MVFHTFPFVFGCWLVIEAKVCVNVCLEFSDLNALKNIVEEVERFGCVHSILIAERLVPARRDGHERCFSSQWVSPENRPTRVASARAPKVLNRILIQEQPSLMQAAEFGLSDPSQTIGWPRRNRRVVAQHRAIADHGELASIGSG